ncbi:hypothetical protein H0H92_004616 [Tricholoma furcatifolium]|nr:hypothetical protein H0H92_004616 [Tricholoma furcatifolium]
MAASTHRTTAQGARGPQVAEAVVEASKRASKKGSTGRRTAGKQASKRTTTTAPNENTDPAGGEKVLETPGSQATNPRVARDDLQSIGNISDAAAELEALKAALAAAKAENAKLIEEKEAEAARDKATKNKPVKMVPRPQGTAGHHFSIQEEMGLGDTVKKAETYKALVRYIRRLTDQSPINWENSWTKISPRDKANLFEVCRKEHPILTRYVNDWATEEIVKQYLKNKRNYAYRKNHLTRPEGYEHLKLNSSKRSGALRCKRVARSRVQASDDEEIDQGSDGSHGDEDGEGSADDDGDD